MKVYAVGGAVRDELLGRSVQDHDYVVVGSTPDEMLRRGFRPVGADFPVFLHPETQEEYALARSERKTAPGYKGFVFHAMPDVTLEQDLARRDLTINAMARDESGTLIDPFGGERDLRAGVLRHVSDAFVEDPVRILRVARFAARFGFTIAAETLTLMQRMVANGEVDALVPERVWQELATGLMETKPSKMFEALRECGALMRLLPEVDRLFGVPQPAAHHPEIDTGIHVMMALDLAARSAAPLDVRFALLVHDVGKALTPPAEWPRHLGHESSGIDVIAKLCTRLRVPNDCRDLAVMVSREHTNVHRALELRAGTIEEVLSRCDAYRQPERFSRALDACEFDARGRKDREGVAYPQRAHMLAALIAARGIDAGAIAAQVVEPSSIGQRVREARSQAIAHYLRTAHTGD